MPERSGNAKPFQRVTIVMLFETWTVWPMSVRSVSQYATLTVECPIVRADGQSSHDSAEARNDPCGGIVHEIDLPSIFIDLLT